MGRFFLFFIAVVGWAADYDCVFIGSSPIVLFEALYQYHSGKSVAIFEESLQCGGAWKTLSLCGIDNVDLGCHDIGNQDLMKEFLEEYAGLHIVSLTNPSGLNPLIHKHEGFYFSRGCHELLSHLEYLIAQTSIALWLGYRVDDVSIQDDEAILTGDSFQCTAKKVFGSYYSYFSIDGEARTRASKNSFHHLYLLIADPTPARFSYHGHLGRRATRAMNLTHFTDLTGTGLQLIAIQVNQPKDLLCTEEFLQELKKKKLIDEEAYLIREEPYTYEQWPPITIPSQYAPYIEKLDTSAIWNMGAYIPRWKEVLPLIAQ
ncbi:MAG: hypothetical protein KGJ02_03605 [Verrucomicrobiota bacterium]|nr:hypothetical protein [Verrucomicrobiota bacterium]